MSKGTNHRRVALLEARAGTVGESQRLILIRVSGASDENLKDATGLPPRDMANETGAEYVARLDQLVGKNRCGSPFISIGGYVGDE